MGSSKALGKGDYDFESTAVEEGGHVWGIWGDIYELGLKVHF